MLPDDRGRAARGRRRRASGSSGRSSSRAGSGSTRTRSPTRSAQQLSADAADGSGREPAPGLHGTGIDSVQVGDQTLDPDAPNRIAYGPDTEFTVNFTNQGENDEVDIDVVLRIEGGPKPIRVTEERRRRSPRAQTASATLSLDTPPPLDTPVDITVEVKAVPGEEKKDNNKAEYAALFSQQ